MWKSAELGNNIAVAGPAFDGISDIGLPNIVDGMLQFIKQG